MKCQVLALLACVPFALSLNIESSPKARAVIVTSPTDQSSHLQTFIGFRKAANHPEKKEKLDLEAKVPGIIDEESLEGNHALDSIHSVAKHIIVPIASVFLLSMALGHLLSLSKYTSWMPDSAATLFVALILGRVMRSLADANNGFTEEHFVFGASTTLNLVLLPPIIFGSGWSLRRSDFIYQFNPIIIFAVFGTLISTFVIGYSSWALSNYFGLHVVSDMRSNMVFAALISAVDPVATLCSYKALKVEPLLNIMVFGEATINDAVAVVIFTIINERWNSLSYVRAAGRMTQLLFGSMLFGLITAGVLIFIMRITKMNKKPAVGILFIFMSAYLVYGAAEATGMFSGIISSLLAGIMFGAYGRLHLGGHHGIEEADVFFDLVCELADKAVFVLCGASTAMITSSRGIIFGFLAVALCYIGRAVSVGACGPVANLLKKQVGDPHLLTPQHLFMMWHGGLRGGIALLLALEIDGTWCKYKATIVNGTFIVICVMLLVNGGSTEFFLKTMGIKTGCTDEAWDALKPDEGGKAQDGLKRMDSTVKYMLSDVEIDDDEKTTLMAN